jgi:hypothetical protein
MILFILFMLGLGCADASKVDALPLRNRSRCLASANAFYTMNQPEITKNLPTAVRKALQSINSLVYNAASEALGNCGAQWCFLAVALGRQFLTDACGASVDSADIAIRYQAVSEVILKSLRDPKKQCEDKEFIDDLEVVITFIEHIPSVSEHEKETRIAELLG